MNELACVVLTGWLWCVFLVSERHIFWLIVARIASAFGCV
jgi:hypothetical protein